MAKIYKELKNFTNGSGFITRLEISKFCGYRQPKSVDKFLKGLPRLNNKFYLIKDVAEVLERHFG